MKKILTLFLILVLALTVMVGCDMLPDFGISNEDLGLPTVTPDDDGKDETPEVDADLQAAYDYVHQMVKSVPESTKANYSVPLIAVVGEKSYDVAWEILGTDVIVINDGTVVITGSEEADINYTLKFTVTNENGETLSKEYNKVVPKIEAEEGVVDPVAGTAYKFGFIHGNLENAVYYLKGGMDGYYLATTTDMSLALDVYVEEVEGGYHFYCMVDGTKTYINVIVSSSGYINSVYSTSNPTVYTYSKTAKTLVATVDGTEYWIGTSNEKTYTTVGPVKTSANPFYCQFYAIPDDLVHEHTFENGKCECGEKDPDYTVTLEYPVVNELKNGDVVIIGAPAFDIALSVNKTSYYNVGVDYSEGFSAFGNTEKFVVTVNGDGSYTFTSKTGVVIALGDSYSSLNNSGAHSSWNVIAKEGAEGIFYLKNTGRDTEYLEWYASNENWSVYHPETLDSCYELSFYLVEAGADVPACEHNYESAVTAPTCTEGGYTTHTCSLCGNTYKSDYTDATGHTYVDGACSCGAKDPNAVPAGSDVELTVDSLGIPSQSYTSSTATVGGVSFEFIQIGNYGDGIQVRDKNGNTSTLWNTTAFSKGIAKIVLVYSDSKDVTYANADCEIFTFGNAMGEATCTVKLSTTAGEKTYTITPDAETYTFFKFEHDLSYTMYWKSITIVLADGSVVTPPACEHTNTTTNTVDATCTAAGSTTVVCNDCGVTVSTTELPKLDHTYVDGKCECGAEDPSAVPAGSDVELTVDSLGVASNSYAAGTATVGGVSFEFIQIGNYGDGIQVRDKNGNTSTLWNTTAFSKGIAKIVLVYSDSKDVTYANADCEIFTFGNAMGEATCTVKLSTTAGEKTYTITPDAETYTFFKFEHDLSYTMYWKSITIVLADGSVVTPPACEHTNTTTNTVDATCTAAGSTTVVCNDCGVTVSTTELPKLDHTYVGGVCACSAVCPHTNVAAGETCGVCGVTLPAESEGGDVEATVATVTLTPNVTENINSFASGDDITSYTSLAGSEIFTLTVGDKTNNSNQVYLSTGGEIRLYSDNNDYLGNTLTIASTKKIVSIAITYAAANRSGATFTIGETTVAGGTEITEETITVNANSVTIANNKTSGQLRITSIVITYEE